MGHTTVSATVQEHLPQGLLSLRWSPCQLGIDGGFTIKLSESQRPVWAWMLLIPGYKSVIGVVVEDPNDSVAGVRTIFLSASPGIHRHIRFGADKEGYWEVPLRPYSFYRSTSCDYRG